VIDTDLTRTQTPASDWAHTTSRFTPAYGEGNSLAGPPVAMYPCRADLHCSQASSKLDDGTLVDEMAAAKTGVVTKEPGNPHRPSHTVQFHSHPISRNLYHSSFRRTPAVHLACCLPSSLRALETQLAAPRSSTHHSSIRLARGTYDLSNASVAHSDDCRRQSYLRDISQNMISPHWRIAASA